MVLEVTEQTFDAEVIKSELPTVVDFWAPWCGPCQLIGPMMEKFAEQYEGKVKFCKLNVDENQQLAANAGVESIPLLVFFKDGKRVAESLGLVPPSEIKPKIEALL
jgi:thioredoxin 1